MSKFKSGKRYSDILTILLVIVIVGIIGLLCYFGYQAIVKYNVETEAADAVEEFYKTLNTTNSDDDDDENTENVTGNLSDFIDTNVTTTESSSSSSSTTKTYLSGYEVKGTIKIKKTGIEYPILEKVTVASLKAATAILEIATCDEITTKVTELNVPGTNALILGHNYRNGQFFSDNDKLSNGDTIQITDSSGTTVTYTIYNMYYTTADDTSFITRELDANTREITLQTCNDDSSQRLIIWAKDN